MHARFFFFFLASNLLIPVAASAQNPQKKSQLSFSLSAGKFGNALDARLSAVVVAGQDKFRQPPLTVECWAKLLTKSGFNILVASDPKESAQHWELYSYAGKGDLAVYLPGMQPSEIRSGVNICDERWHYLAMTYDGKMVQLFVDGKQVAAQIVKRKEGMKPRPGPLTIGMVRFGKNSEIRCNGLIDDVRISNAIRTIRAVPEKPLPLDPQTVGLWRFDEDHSQPVDPAWTPRPAIGKAAAWEKETDKDWIDARFQKMDTGPMLGATFAYPSWSGKQRALRGVAVRLGKGGKAGVIFDRSTMRMAVGWTGGYLQHGNRRFGLLNTPAPAGKIVFATRQLPGWSNPKNQWKRDTRKTIPLPQPWAHYRGLYVHGKRVVFAYTVGETDVLESSSLVSDDKKTLAIARSFEIDASDRAMQMLVCELSGDDAKSTTLSGLPAIVSKRNQEATAVALLDGGSGAQLRRDGNDRVVVSIPPHKDTIRFKILLWHGNENDVPKFADLAKVTLGPERLSKWTKPGPPRYPASLITKGKIGNEPGTFQIDTLTVPYENPHNALFFIGGVDFMPNGDIAVCTAHGDVWLVNADENLERIIWKRFATGLYQPLGLRVIDGKIHVIERGQLTRLHDFNNDGEADFYENVNNDWDVAGGEHSFDMCLETDPKGNFYFFATGETQTPTGGCLMRISKDGKTSEIFATGFRHPAGMGMSPDGIPSGADQQGNWMPATRIDLYEKDGFYGDMRAHHRKTPPKIYDGPLLWLPRHFDNSAGGQVWVPQDAWGPLSGKMLHLSYGRCRALLVLQQQVRDIQQAAATDLGWQFLSGVMRGRFHPKEGHLYVVGMDGWQTAALRDGCLQRVRFTGKPVRLPVAFSVHENGIRIEFSDKLDRKIAENVSRYQIKQWNYRWRAEYGSKRWSVRDPKMEGEDVVPIQRARLLADGKTVFLEVNGLGPVMQMQVEYRLATESGCDMSGVICNTIHRLGGRIAE